MSGLMMDVRDEPDRVVISATGAVDLATCNSLGESIRRVAMKRPRKILVDLSALSFIDLATLRVLLEANTDASTDGYELVLYSGDGAAKRLFDLVKRSRSSRPAAPQAPRPSRSS